MKPKKDHNYELRIGDSFYNSAKTYQTVQYQFKPTATIDRHKRGKMIKTHTNGKVKVLVEFTNNASKGQPYSVGQGFYTECKDIECVLIFDGEKFQLERLSGIATGISLTKQAQPANDSDNLTSSLSEAEFQGFIQRPKDKNYTLISTMQNTNNNIHHNHHNHHNHHKKPVQRNVHALPVHTVNNTFHKANNSNPPSTTAPSSVPTTTPSKPTPKDEDRMSDDEDDTGSEEDSEGSEDDSEGDTGDFTSRLMATIGDGTSANTAPLAVETVVSSNPFSLGPTSHTPTPTPTSALVPPTADQPMKGNDSSESSSEDSESGSSESSESGSSEDSESGSSESSSDESSESSSDSENK